MAATATTWPKLTMWKLKPLKNWQVPQWMNASAAYTTRLMPILTAAPAFLVSKKSTKAMSGE